MKTLKETLRDLYNEGCKQNPNTLTNAFHASLANALDALNEDNEEDWIEKAAKKIMDDLKDRNIGLDYIDEETLIEIKQDIIDIIRNSEREGKK